MSSKTRMEGSAETLFRCYYAGGGSVEVVADRPDAARDKAQALREGRIVKVKAVRGTGDA